MSLRELRRGDFGLLDFPGGDGADHVAMVTRGLRSGSVRTIDGNSSDRVRRNAYATSQIAMGVRVTR